ncbi:GDP-fucose protein O-fucosyltransferase 1-like isoform X2 [Saccoglossus kowalevskii]|uniref:GDP-fucose protein O-fucosyltransferase 1 n=1 Tax=Saccoglossus kowalevskii TaxID=10224 RepID=A0ABM0MTA8_SACKO|nr:PREDICTED: GDP-fucose protein O-fucosyltransferase 1-like isoform X1 [Saccoglossus kowalevskii]
MLSLSLRHSQPRKTMACVLGVAVRSVLVLAAFMATSSVCKAIEWDPRGYVLYCPCMGRFGNQVDQFIGSLFFAKTLDRVLVAPPFIVYQHHLGHDAKNIYVPFTDIFDLEAVQEYHSVISMEDFMDDLAPYHWPQGQRIAYCSRKAADFNEDSYGDWICPRPGNPFQDFWEYFDINFDRSEIWDDLHYNVDYDEWRKGWVNTYDPSSHPVITMMGAPAQFPVTEANEPLQRYLQWNPETVEEGDDYIEKNLKRPFIAIHLRNGADWSSTCNMADGKTYTHLMSSQQCVGYHRDRASPVTRAMCMQTEVQVVREVREVAERMHAQSVYVATDHQPMLEDLADGLEDLNIEVFHLDPEKPQLDLYIMGKADHFIGNCVSSFSAFVKRERDINERPTTFFGWKGTTHDEL